MERMMGSYGQTQRGTGEGRTTKAIEEQTSKIPSSTWLWAAGGSVLASLGLMVMGRRQEANFVGQWVPTLLLFGLYNKMVKTMGSE